MSKTIKTLAAAVALATSSSAVMAADVKVMVLYSQPAASAVSNMSTTINNLVAYSNRVYRDNSVNITLDLAHSEQATSSNAVPSSSWLSAVRNSSYVNDLRSTHKADLVVLMGKAEQVTLDNGQSGYVCGIGYVGNPNATSSAGYSISGVDCGNNTFIHELGHNMGLTHSRKQGDTSGGFATYGKGYGVDNDFTTVMAYPHVYGSAVQLDIFSDPDWDNCNGKACGEYINGQQDSNSYRALNEIANSIASYF